MKVIEDVQRDRFTAGIFGALKIRWKILKMLLSRKHVLMISVSEAKEPGDDVEIEMRAVNLKVDKMASFFRDFADYAEGGQAILASANQIIGRK